MEKINLIVVFIEGLLSFLSPCILPILPIYLSMLSSSSVDSLKEDNSFVRSSLFRNTLFFSLGISTTFFILGSSVKIFSSFITNNKDLISFAGGIIIVLMGLFYVDILKLSFLNREKRYSLKVNNMNILSAYLLGFTFSFGWTPCIGPILASVLIMSSSTSNLSSGYLLIGVYALGFILPFIIVSLFYNRLFKSLDKLKSNMNTIKQFGGIILIIAGMSMVYSGFDGVRAIFYGKDKAPIKAEENINNKEEEEDEYRLKSIDFKLFDQYGNEHILSKYEGKTVFLNFWATWCPPCRGEMPHIEDIYKDYGLNKDEVVILGVASPHFGNEGSEEEINKFLNDNGYTFPVVMDYYGELAEMYGISAFPTTFIIDKEGYVTQYVPGALDKDTMKYLIDTFR